MTEGRRLLCSASWIVAARYTVVILAVHVASSSAPFARLHHDRCTAVRNYSSKAGYT